MIHKRDPRNLFFLLENEKGAAFATALVVLLVLSLLGTVLLIAAQKEVGISLRGKQANQAFHIAEAGIDYAIQKLSSDWTFSGATEDLGTGSFTVTVTNIDVSQKQIDSTGKVGEAKRSVRAVVRRTPTAMKYTIFVNKKLTAEARKGKYEEDGAKITTYGKVTIVGRIHSNKDIKMERDKNYNECTVDFLQKDLDDMVTWVNKIEGNAVPDPLPAYFKQVPTKVIDLPTVDYGYYQDKANFLKNTVYKFTHLKGDSEKVKVWLKVKGETLTIYPDDEGCECKGEYSEKCVYYENGVNKGPLPKDGLELKNESVINVNGEIKIYGQGTVRACILACKEKKEGALEECKIRVQDHKKGNVGCGGKSEGCDCESKKVASDITFLPWNSLALVSREIKFRLARVQVGELENGAICYATKKLEVKGHEDTEANGHSKFYGSLVTGEPEGSEISEIKFADKGDEVYLEKTPILCYPVGWQEWGTYSVDRVSWEEVR